MWPVSLDNESIHSYIFSFAVISYFSDTEVITYLKQMLPPSLMKIQQIDSVVHLVTNWQEYLTFSRCMLTAKLLVCILARGIFSSNILCLVVCYTLQEMNHPFPFEHQPAGASSENAAYCSRSYILVKTVSFQVRLVSDTAQWCLCCVCAMCNLGDFFQTW